ncbi:gluconate:H+ symporter [Streptomyces sp. NPDC059398]|uniref:GntT/GntP/DsdX family permease n=1 Tax=Streptomyces sp. NPDC059398 TaxID=3346820 RepID=UPI003682D9EF
MNPNIEHLLLAAAAIVFLIVLITKCRLHPSLALTVAALALGMANGISPAGAVKDFEQGFGDTLSDTGPVIALGAMLGGILLGSGGAYRIADAFVVSRPVKWIPLAIAVAALIIGLPNIFDVSFVMLVPLAYAVAKRTGTHLLFVGLPLAAGLYTAHGLLPPHPAPTAAVTAYHANTGLTIGLGLVIAIPTVLICGPLLTKLSSRAFGPAPDLDAGPVASVSPQPEGRRAGPVSLPLTLTAVLLPPFLMLVGTLGSSMTRKNSLPWQAFETLDNPILALLVAVLFAFFVLGPRAGFLLRQMQTMSGKGLGAVGPVLLIIGAGGGLAQMLASTGVSHAITGYAVHWSAPPLLLAWGIAALLRICLGSATVATITTAGIVAPFLTVYPGLSPELLVLATASGSVMLSHVNDSGFWLFKEYFQLSVGKTFRTWSVMLSVQSLIGLAGVLLLSLAV